MLHAITKTHTHLTNKAFLVSLITNLLTDSELVSTHDKAVGSVSAQRPFKSFSSQHSTDNVIQQYHL